MDKEAKNNIKTGENREKKEKQWKGGEIDGKEGKLMEKRENKWNTREKLWKKRDRKTPLKIGLKKIAGEKIITERGEWFFFEYIYPWSESLPPF